MIFTEELRKKKAIAKERELLNELKKLMSRVDPTTRMLKVYKESWIDKLRYKKVKFQRFIEKGRRIMDNATFERDQKNLFMKVGGETKHVGKLPEMEKFVKSLGETYGKKMIEPLKCHGWKA